MDETRLKKLLSKHGFSNTRPRQQVFGALRIADEPITVINLTRAVRGVDKVSVYRIVELFEKIGIIHRVWSGFKSKVELSEAFSPHHHHFNCIKCGKTVALSSEGLEKNLKILEKRHGFKLVEHSVELHGYCHTCRQKGEMSGKLEG